MTANHGKNQRMPLGFAQIAMLLIFIAALLYLGWVGYGALPDPTPTPTPALVFNGERALDFAQAQCDFGPRPAGSPASRQTGDWIIEQLERAEWAVETHEFDWDGTPVRNIIAKAGQGSPIMVGAHYDTRLVADQDPDPNLQALPVLGANDGASGVAVLLELALALDTDRLQNEVWLTFFDAEDNGRIEGWEQWAIGSTRLAQDLAAADNLPVAMFLADMVGDVDQRFPYEANSDPILSEQLWEVADSLGYGDVFIPELGPAITDDHIGFLNAGVPAVDIIDFDYPYWHTTADTCDKLSAESLGRVGTLLETYLEQAYLQDVIP